MIRQVAGHMLISGQHMRAFATTACKDLINPSRPHPQPYSPAAPHPAPPQLRRRRRQAPPARAPPCCKRPSPSVSNALPRPRRQAAGPHCCRLPPSPTPSRDPRRRLLRPRRIPSLSLHPIPLPPPCSTRSAWIPTDVARASLHPLLDRRRSVRPRLARHRQLPPPSGHISPGTVRCPATSLRQHLPLHRLVDRHVSRLGCLLSLSIGYILLFSYTYRKGHQLPKIKRGKCYPMPRLLVQPVMFVNLKM
ncbi:vegetative cell wall protein gp1 [Sorghum bicolor]|uniref:vegetative cell wall protein gp1 n=1 Tax=Sorghum bicolor TaxID=4558 RepID=UPI000B424DB9|nr:vegetative cell wall protein gp1 [Sorghum bicolor]|eukprot:XP_021303823.1 vegetative cell wall protein gp1 [Sorghum bicolor]